jgi:hypothetical protein
LPKIWEFENIKKIVIPQTTENRKEEKPFSGEIKCEAITNI